MTLLGVTLNGQYIEVTDPAEGKRRDTVGLTANYAYGTFTGFELRPAQLAALPIVTYSAVAPSLTATTVPDALGRYAELIGQGTLARILGAKDKSYTDKGGADDAMGAWMDGVGSAKGDALRGFSRVAIRTRPARF
jgi:hypothetical protein